MNSWWAPYAWDMKAIEGIYIGYRYYCDGRVTGDSEFIPTWPLICVALIIPHERHNPVPVLYDSLEAING